MRLAAQDPIVEKILQSNLLSGGISLGHLSTYSAESITHLKTHAEILDEKPLIDALNHPAKEQKDAVIYAGVDADTDLMIDQLQKSLKKQRMKYPHCLVGGDSGMKLSRAAFAIMLKFSDLSQDFEMLALEISG
jgi:hypothetical protein